MSDINLEFLENDFTILEKLGCGGMGQVYKAHQKSMDRLVAIKILQIDLCQNLIYIERFKREARLAGKFCHKNGVQVFDIGCNQGQYYYIMEYVDGIKPCREKLRNEVRFEEKYVINVLKQVLSVLKEAEKMKIIHRDIKPDNLMLTNDGVVKLADLGIAREVNDDAGLTIQNVAIGTPQYMAPEQAQGKPIDLRTDQYSLGISAFQMLTGRTPFTGKSTMEILVQHVKSPMIKPSSLCKGISDQMDKVILKMTEKDPNNRFQSIDEIMVALDNMTLSKVKKTTKRKKTVKSNGEQTARIEKRAENNAYNGILLLLALLMLIVGGYFLLNPSSKTSSNLITGEKAILIANQLLAENRYEESLESLKIALKQIPLAEQKDVLKKTSEIEKKIADSTTEKIMVIAFDSVANCEKGIKELDLVIEKFKSNAILAKSKKSILQSRISQITSEENRLLELDKEKAKEEIVNNLSIAVNDFLFTQNYKQAMEAVNEYKVKNPEENPKLKLLVENIEKLESEYGAEVFIQANTYLMNKNFDQCHTYLKSIKENCFQSNLVAKIDDQIQKIPQLKIDNEKEISKKNKLEFSQMKDAIFSLLKLAELKAAKTKLESYKSNGISEANYDFFAKVIENYSQIYGRIETGLSNEFKDQLLLNKIGNRVINVYITSIKNGVIHYSFMDNKLELTTLNEEWAQTYTAIATKITRQTKSCRLLRLCHFAYVNGDLEGAYTLMKEAEALGLEKNESDKYTKIIKDDYLNWLDIHFDRILEKASSLLAENNKSRANLLLNDFIKKYGETVIYKERKEEFDKILALTGLN